MPRYFSKFFKRNLTLLNERYFSFYYWPLYNNVNPTAALYFLPSSAFQTAVKPRPCLKQASCTVIHVSRAADRCHGDCVP